MTHHPCIVAVNEHVQRPALRDPGRPRRPSEAVIDLWSKVAGDPRAVYYDATWMGYCGREVPARARVWEAVKARDAAVVFVTESVAAGRTLHGYEVDDVARGFIEERGFGPTSCTAPATPSATRSTATA